MDLKAPPPSTKEKKTNLKQCWFPGVHSDVGGSYADAAPRDFSDIALAWMIDQCRQDKLLAFEAVEKFIAPAIDAQKRSLWAAQPIHNSMTGVFKAGKVLYRNPGEYVHTDAWTGKPTPIGPTHEYIHPSVRVRLLKSSSFKLDWQPVAMNGFHLVETPETDLTTGWKWVKTVKVAGSPDKIIEIPEYKIKAGSLEDKLTEPEDEALLSDVESSKKLQEINGQKSWIRDHIW